MKTVILPILFILLIIIVLGSAGCHSAGRKAPITDSIKITRFADTISIKDSVPLKNMFGINSYEWNFEENPAEPNKRNKIYEANMALIKCFTAVRHYMNWNKLENSEGNYTYNPTNNGSWYYDVMYARCKRDSIVVLADLKNLPVWMMNTYPAGERDDENVPANFGADRSKPASYVIQARTAFQFAARYGYNKNINPALIKVDTRPRWANDAVNAVKIGLGYIKYIECGNENDRWWKGNNATQTPEEYAANMSAFYDGHKGTLGKNAGVKTADPAMKVVMGGLATADTSYVRRMINWCKANRGYLPNGKVNLCFDVINYHWYANNGDIFLHQRATTGVAPELCGAGKVADGFVKIANGLPVWVTETGYDINQKSYQHAPAIGNKSALKTQADWILRTALMYKRHGIDRLFFYQLFDAEKKGEEQYMTSGLAESPKRRPAAYFILQVSKLMGNYRYAGTVLANPLVDRYKLGSKTMYVLMVPDQQNRMSNYQFDMAGHKTALVHIPKVGSNMMNTSKVAPVDGKLSIKVSETPVFVELVD